MVFKERKENKKFSKAIEKLAAAENPRTVIAFHGIKNVWDDNRSETCPISQYLKLKTGLDVSTSGGHIGLKRKDYKREYFVKTPENLASLIHQYDREAKAGKGYDE